MTKPPTLPRAQPRTGVAFVLIGLFFFSSQDVAIKWISGDYPVHEIVVVRSLAALPLLLLIARWQGGWGALRPRRTGLQLLRSAIMLCAYTSYFLALAALPLADTVALFFVGPLFVAALSGPLLGERVGPRRWLAVAVGFVGVLIMVRPGAGAFDPTALLVVVAAFCYALATILTRRLGQTESGVSMAMVTTLTYLVVGAAIGLAVGGGGLATSPNASLQFLLRAWKLPTRLDLVFMAFAGFASALAFYFSARAYSISRPSSIVPLEYLGVPLSVVWGFLVWGELPGLHSLVGMVLIVASGLYVMRRQDS